jgi:hypothetical protein
MIRIRKCADNPEDFQLHWGPADRFFVKSRKILGNYFFFDSQTMYSTSIILLRHEMKILLNEMIPTLDSVQRMYNREERKHPERQTPKHTSISVISSFEGQPQIYYKVSTCNGIEFKKYLCWRQERLIDCTELNKRDLHTFYTLCPL